MIYRKVKHNEKECYAQNLCSQIQGQGHNLFVKSCLFSYSEEYQYNFTKR